MLRKASNAFQVLLSRLSPTVYSYAGRATIMATFAEYPPQTMASNNDFQLYTYPGVWNNDQGFLPTSDYPDESYMGATAFDTYQQSIPYTQPEHYSFGTGQLLSKQMLQLPTSSHYSPAHSFDTQNPPHLSSTSDSGASVHSTISSTMGSPPTQPLVSTGWMQQQGLEILPNIAQNDHMDHDVYTTSAFDFESLPASDKGCVGEFATVPSSQPFHKGPLFYSASPSSLCYAHNECTFTGVSSLHPSSPASSPQHAPRLTETILDFSQASVLLESASPHDSMFKSPSTPASAISPVLERLKGNRKRKASIAPTSTKRARASSPLAHALSYSKSDLPARPQAPPPTLSSSFFFQSSGNFVPPLELSCPFDSLSRIFLCLGWFQRITC